MKLFTQLILFGFAMNAMADKPKTSSGGGLRTKEAKKAETTEDLPIEDGITNVFAIEEKTFTDLEKAKTVMIARVGFESEAEADSTDYMARVMEQCQNGEEKNMVICQTLSDAETLICQTMLPGKTNYLVKPNTEQDLVGLPVTVKELDNDITVGNYQPTLCQLNCGKGSAECRAIDSSDLKADLKKNTDQFSDDILGLDYIFNDGGQELINYVDTDELELDWSSKYTCNLYKEQLFYAEKEMKEQDELELNQAANYDAVNFVCQPYAGTDPELSFDSFNILIGLYD